MWNLQSIYKPPLPSEKIQQKCEKRDRAARHTWAPHPALCLGLQHLTMWPHE